MALHPHRKLHWIARGLDEFFLFLTYIASWELMSSPQFYPFKRPSVWDSISTSLSSPLEALHRGDGIVNVFSFFSASGWTNREDLQIKREVPIAQISDGWLHSFLGVGVNLRLREHGH